MRVFFWTALVLVLITVFCSMRLRDSRLGRAWIAIREDEIAAAAMGIPLMRTKTWAYATGAFFGGVAGAFYASFKCGDVPGDFFFNISVFILCMVILGGMGNIPGVIFGAVLPRVPRPGGAGEHRRLDQRPLRHRHDRRAAVRVRDLRRDPRGDDALPARGPDPDARRAAEFHEGVHDQPLYDVADAGELMALLEIDAAAQGVRRARRRRRRRLQRPAQGSIVSLIGPNGAGKTTFFNMLTGVYKPTAGRVVFDGEDMTGKPPHAFTERGIGRTFQNIRLFQNMTALENVLVGMHSRLRATSFSAILRTPGVKREEATARASARASCSSSPGLRRQRRRDRAQPLLRRPAPARGRARARDRAEAAAARRADRRHEPAGDRRLHRVRRAAARRSRT